LGLDSGDASQKRILSDEIRWLLGRLSRFPSPGTQSLEKRLIDSPLAFIRLYSLSLRPRRRWWLGHQWLQQSRILERGAAGRRQIKHDTTVLQLACP
jgi:hypothetical protein